jgi:gluconolactonase
MKRTLLAALVVAPLCFTQTPAPAPPPASGIERLDPGMDALVAPDAKVEKFAGGFKYLEAPLWRKGTLWISDLSGDILYQVSADGKATEILNPGGHESKERPEGQYPGPNGLANGPNGNLVFCQHGDRRIVQMTADGKITTIADKVDGKRLNSPNDVAYFKDGSLYFTDPPYGLPKGANDPGKEIAFNGVYRLANGKVELATKELAVPNGIAFSPDYKWLYLSNSEGNNRYWSRCDVSASGAVSNCNKFAEMNVPERGVPDGLKVDSLGNLWGSGPGGIWVYSPEGKRLGTIRTPEKPSNCTFGDDGKTLYITAVTSVYKVRLKVAGEKGLYD